MDNNSPVIKKKFFFKSHRRTPSQKEGGLSFTETPNQVNSQPASMKTVGEKIAMWLLALILHLVAIGVIVYFAFPLVRWYYDKIPLRGVDFFNSLSYVSNLSRHFSTFFSGWKYFWYEGSPMGADYPFLHFYLMVPFAKLFGLVRGVQIYALTSTLALVVFSYLLFYELSRNRVFSVILGIALVYSANLYQPLVWAGGIPYYSTGLFLPLCLWLAVKYLKTKKADWFLALALACGIGMMGHIQPFLNSIFPVLGLLFLFWGGGEKFLSWSKIKDLFKLAFLGILIALPGIYQMLVQGGRLFVSLIFTLFGKGPSGTALGGPGVVSKSLGSYGAGSTLIKAPQSVVTWASQQFLLSFKDTNSLIWLGLGLSSTIFIFSILFLGNRFKRLLFVLPFAFGLAFAILYIYLLSIGINIFQGSWYKVLWPIPITAGALAAALWGQASRSFLDLDIFKKKKNKLLRLGGEILVSLCLVVGSIYLFRFKFPVKLAIQRIDSSSVASSAYPDALNTKPDDDFQLKGQGLTPSFMDPHSRDYRLYIIDATVNIWWNSLFDLPLARGYIDPPTGEEASSLFWLNSALGPSLKGTNSSLVDDWKAPEDLAKENTRFLLDWFAIKYFEGNHLSQNSSTLSPFATSEELIQKKESLKIAGALFLDLQGKEHWLPSGEKDLNFYEVKDEVVSPIMSATSAPAVAVIGDNGAYDTIGRLLALLNLNSQNLVFVRGPKFIDDWKLEDFIRFDGLIIYSYDYHNHDKAWQMIDDYLNQGGKVFLETGGEVKESDSIHLPDRFPKQLPSFFPIRQTERLDMGKDWELTTDSAEFQSIDFSQFSPLDMDGKSWNISRPTSIAEVSPESQVLLQDKGYPVVVSKTVGTGEIVWSGLNFPYHIIRNQNAEEAMTFYILLSKLINLENQPKPMAKIDWVSSEVRKVTGQGAKGILLKEQYFPGWTASLRDNQGKRRLKIYPAGPTLPGFMYVSLPSDGSFEVVFKYKGDPKIWLYTVISLTTIIIILDYVLLRKKLFGALIRKISFWFKKRVGQWWEKEEEQ